MSSKIYFNKLDSLRTFAFLLVFWQHISSFYFNKIEIDSILLKKILTGLIFTGGAGVQIFFVLSGFLITYLLLIEENRNNKINLKFFYMRRILRIWPAYYLVILLGVYILPASFNSINFKGNVLMNLFFLNNFNITDSPVSITWSVAIEEQFYLFWPILFTIFKPKKILTLSSLILSFSLIYSIYYSGTTLGYYGTLSNLKYLMVGCLGASMYFNKNKYLFRILNWKNFKLTYIVIITFLCYLLPIILPSFSILFNFILIFLYILLIFNLVINTDNTLTVFSQTGRYTYGLYLYHPTVLLLCKVFFDKFDIDYHNNFLNYFVLAFTAALFTYLAAKFSYDKFEIYFLKLKYKYKF